MNEQRSLYILKNQQKKCVYNIEYWHRDDGSSFELEEMYRWGETVLNLLPEEVTEIQELIDLQLPIIASEYEIYDQNLMDGCSLYFNDCVGTTVEQLEEMWDDGASYAIETAGYDLNDVEVQYVGICTLEPYQQGN